MLHHPSHHRMRGPDLVDDPDAALATLALAVHRPFRPETIVVVLDEARRGRAIVIVTGTQYPDSVVDVVECITRGVDAEHVGAIVVGSVRPGACEDDGLDVDRWLEMSQIASDVGVELLEWFVIGNEVRCPRDDLGEAPRW